jgi:hypothetical protein
MELLGFTFLPSFASATSTMNAKLLLKYGTPFLLNGAWLLGGYICLQAVEVYDLGDF